MKRTIFLCISLAIFLFAFVQFFAPQSTPYDYYKRLGDTFAHGQICLQDNPAWLNELIPVQGKGFCVVYPITPALLFVPFVLVGFSLSQTLMAHIIFALTGVGVFWLFFKKKFSSKDSLTMAIAWSLGTIFFSLSAVGSAWYFAQTVGAFFIVLTFIFFDPKKRWSLLAAGVFFGLAANARLPLHIYGVFFLLLMIKEYAFAWKKIAVTCVIFGIGFFPLFFTQRLYNYARYGTFADAGYYLIPGKFEEEDFKYGEFNIRNIPKHLKVFIAALPKKVDTFPYIVPSYYGLSVLITSPFLVIGLYYLIRAKKYAELTTIALLLGLEMSHGTVGFTQFGYRFGLDIYPLLFLGFPKKLFETRAVFFFYVLIAFAIIVNFWGVLAFHYSWFIW